MGALPRVDDAPPRVDLFALYKERAESTDFKMRNQAYTAYEDAYLGRDTAKRQQYVTWRPMNIDGWQTGNAAKDRQLLNLARQFVNHHQASFARMPALRNVPYDSDSIELAERKTQFIQGVFYRSRIKSLQPLQAWRLSVRGDAVYGIEWSETQDDPYILVRVVDPRSCYPDFDLEDPGAMLDNLICRDVTKDWAEKTFNIMIPGDDKIAKYFTYWNDEWRIVAINDRQIFDPRYTFYHGLGYVPWRWCFNQPNGHMGQSDLTETPKLQKLLNDTIVLTMDAARKRIDKSFWGRGISGQVVPKPGEVVVFPNPQAEIHEFPSADPPDVLQSLTAELKSFAQESAGISPISSEGLAAGSIVTGSAIRHQIEAIEARSRAKQVSVEMTFSMLGEYILRVLEARFPDQEVISHSEHQVAVMTGSEVQKWYVCEASYGEFDGLDPMQRGRWALEGLGRLHDDRFAIQVAYPDQDADAMVRRVRDYQLRQAAITGEAQAAAQQAAQGPSGAAGQPQSQSTGLAPQGPPSGGPEAGPPRMMGTPTPPGVPTGNDGRVKISDLQTLLNLVRDRLTGHVWAIGELAESGSATAPTVMVEVESDKGLVQSALQSFNVSVVMGTPPKNQAITLR